MTSHPFIRRRVPSAIAAALFILCGASAPAGDAAPASTAAAKNTAVKFETIAGQSQKRITLSAKAVERLGIQTGAVGQEVVVRRQTVSGMVVYPQGSVTPTSPGTPAARDAAGFGGFGAATPGAAGPIKTIALGSPATAATLGNVAAACTGKNQMLFG